jgi:ArsR family transcriptional regulator, arsenate/arsenite/antimonite-responsive transcriptional repressor
MSYCCPVDPEKRKEWEEHMLQEIDFLEHDIKKPVKYLVLWDTL